MSALTDAGSLGRVVVGIDGSTGARRALDWAAAQARLTHAVLEIVAASGRGGSSADPHASEQYIEGDVEEAAAWAKALAPGAVITTKEVDGPPAAQLIEESEDADLLVVGSRGRGGFASLLLGSVSRKCVHEAHCPVVVVGATGGGRSEREIQPGQAGDVATATHADRHNRIVVGIDGSSSSIAAAEWAATQSELTGDTLEALMTWEWPSTYGWSPGDPEYDPQHDCDVIMGDVLRPIRDQHPGIQIEAVVWEGHPAHRLVEASNRAGLLVVGSCGEGELAEALLGSVTEHCVAHAHCPVVVFRDARHRHVESGRPPAGRPGELS
jgi:nucleotide-binding universal stress UspA family protein